MSMHRLDKKLTGTVWQWQGGEVVTGEECQVIEQCKVIEKQNLRLRWLRLFVIGAEEDMEYNTIPSLLLRC